MNATDVNKENFKVNVFEYVKCQNRLRENLDSDFTLILGQCNKLIQMQLEGIPTCEAVDDISDVINLLKMMKRLSHHTTYQKYHPLYLYTSKKNVYGL